jgi:hypothetical protein
MPMRSWWSMAWSLLKLLLAVVLLVVVGMPVALRVAGLLAATSLSFAAGVALSRIILVICTGMLVWLVVRRAGLKRTLYGTATAFVIVGCLYASAKTIWKDSEYRRVVADFKRAMPLKKRDLDGSRYQGWDEKLSLPASPLTVYLHAADRFDIATARYSDEPESRPLFKLYEYTGISDVRHRDGTIYIVRSISFFWTEWRLTVFDLKTREVVTDRRVDPTDVK